MGRKVSGVMVFKNASLKTGAELEDFFGLAGVEKFLCTGREEGTEAEYGECDTFHSGNIAILKLNPVKS